MRNLKKILTIVFAAALLLQLAVIPTVFATGTTGDDGDFDWQLRDDGITVEVTAYTGDGGAVILPATLSGMTVTKIDSSADLFSGNTKLTAISIPATVDTIEDEAFADCKNLESVTFESGADITSIPASAFSGCVKLTSIEIPSAVTSIGDNAFDGCVSLLSLKLDSALTTIGESAFNNIAITSLKIPANVTTIGDSAFYNCANLATLTFSSGCSPDIGASAFSGETADKAPKFTSINFPIGLVGLGDNCFANCSKLTKVFIPGDSVDFKETVFASTSMAFEGSGGVFANEGSTAQTYVSNHTTETHFTLLNQSVGTPTILSAVSTGFDRATITWSSTERATGYELQKSGSAAGPYTLITTTTGTSYTNTGLTTNSKYYYRVRGFCTVEGRTVYGEYSDPVMVTPIPYAPTSLLAAPGTPSGTTMINTYNSITLTWSAVNGADGYKIYRSYKIDGTYDLIKTQPNPVVTPPKTTAALLPGQIGAMDAVKVKCTFTGLTTGRTYYYKVRAYKTATPVILGDFSAIASTMPTLGQVKDLKVTVASPTSLKLTWTAVLGRTKYEILRYDPVGDKYSKIPNSSSSTTSTTFTDTGLTIGATYSYKVVAYRHSSIVGNAYGPVSSPVSGTPIVSQVTGFTATRYSATKIKLAWTGLTGVSGYQILRSDTLGGTYSPLPNGGTTTSKYYYDTVTTNSTYYYKVRAYKLVDGLNATYGLPSAAAYATASATTIR